MFVNCIRNLLATCCADMRRCQAEGRDRQWQVFFVEKTLGLHGNYGYCHCHDHGYHGYNNGNHNGYNNGCNNGTIGLIWPHGYATNRGSPT